MTTPAAQMKGRFKRIIDVYGEKCWYCPHPAEVTDHFIPEAMGGRSTITNYRPACIPCNSFKGNLHPEFFMFLIELHGYAWTWTKKIRKEIYKGVYDQQFYDVVDEEIRQIRIEQAKTKYTSKTKTWDEQQKSLYLKKLKELKNTEDSNTGLPRSKVDRSKKDPALKGWPDGTTQKQINTDRIST